MDNQNQCRQLLGHLYRLAASLLGKVQTPKAKVRRVRGDYRVWYVEVFPHQLTAFFIETSAFTVWKQGGSGAGIRRASCSGGKVERAMRCKAVVVVAVAVKSLVDVRPTHASSNFSCMKSTHADWIDSTSAEPVVLVNPPLCCFCNCVLRLRKGGPMVQGLGHLLLSLKG